MVLLTTSTLLLSAYATLTTAHGIVQELRGGGQVWEGANPWSTAHSPGWRADNKDYGFVTDVTHMNMTCHRNAASGTQYIPVQAGTDVRLKWSGVWPHPGPALSYLAPCKGSCLSASTSDLEFFKIAESGLVKKFNNTVEGCYWGAYTIRDNNNTAVVRIPANIKPGDYVLRHEIIALHQAYNVSAAQFYPQCANLRVSGTGTLEPKGTKATQLYNKMAPGIKLNIYWPVPTAYAIPGPPIAPGLVFGDAGVGSKVKGQKKKQRVHQREVAVQEEEEVVLGEGA